MTNSTPGEVPFNPFISFLDQHSEEVLRSGYMVVHHDEIPTDAEGFSTLADLEPEGSQRRHALGQAATHVAWMADFTQLPQGVIIADRRMPSDGSIRLVLSQVIGD